MPSEGLLRRINRFKRALSKLNRLKNMDKSLLLADDDALDILENNARIVIEALLDVGRYIIAAKEWEVPSRYRDIPLILHRHQVINADEARLLEGLAGLRNIIVHLYADVDYEKLIGILELVDGMENLMNKLLRYIASEKLDP